MNGERVPRKNGVDIPPVDEAPEGLPGIPVEDGGGAQDPEHEPRVPLMLEEAVKLVVVDGKGGFPA